MSTKLVHRHNLVLSSSDLWYSGCIQPCLDTLLKLRYLRNTFSLLDGRPYMHTPLQVCVMYLADVDQDTMRRLLFVALRSSAYFTFIWLQNSKIFGFTQALLQIHMTGAKVRGRCYRELFSIQATDSVVIRQTISQQSVYLQSISLEMSIQTSPGLT